jgi:hypothetical protein
LHQCCRAGEVHRSLGVSDTTSDSCKEECCERRCRQVKDAA